MDRVVEVLIDNTSLAGAGRMMYREPIVDASLSTSECWHAGPKGTEHARAYYRAHSGPDMRQELIDLESFCEVLTSLVLFERIRWNQDSVTEMGMVQGNWLYALFPAFQFAYEDGIVRGTRSKKDGDRRRSCWLLSGQHVKALLDVELPVGFRLPNMYSDPEHPDRMEFLKATDGLCSTEEEVSLAMFVGRGLYYQSDALLNDLSYIPHRYRSPFLTIPRIAKHSLIAAICAQAPKHQPDFGRQTMNALDSVFEEELSASIGEQWDGHFGGIATAFLSGAGMNPRRAWENVMNFRQSTQGREVREAFADLVRLNAEGRALQSRARIEEIRQQLMAIQRHKYGHSTRSRRTDIATESLVNTLADNFSFLVRPIRSLIPLSVYEKVIQIGNVSIGQTGFQLIFRTAVDSLPARHQ